MSNLRHCALLECLLLLFATTARANDSSFGGNGADLVPLKETRIRMLSEDILLELVPDPLLREGAKTLAWRITARYQFHNPTRNAVALQMGFPESRCSEGEGCNGRGGEFRGLVTTVEGKQISQRVGKVAPKDEWGNMLSRVFLYDVAFRPDQKVDVEHRYVYDRSLHVTGEYLSYLTRTGKLWNGPIGRASFVVRMPLRPWFVVAPKTYRLASYRETRVPGDATPMTELRFEMVDFTPEEDLNLYFANVWVSGLLVFGLADRCPVLHDGEIRGDFDATDAETLERCAALPLALHGAPLEEKLSAFFYGPRELSEEERLYAASGEGAALQVIRLQPNPEYRAEFLSTGERQYVARAKEALAKVGTARTGATSEGAIARAPAPAREPSSASPAPARGCGACAARDNGREDDGRWLVVLVAGIVFTRRTARRARS